MKKTQPNKRLLLTAPARCVGRGAPHLRRRAAAEPHVKRKRDQQLRSRERRNGLADSGQPGCGAELSEEHRALEAVSRDSHD